jgi:MinD-like ATPase involved in chromosome partitioning or flagellar assembly
LSACAGRSARSPTSGPATRATSASCASRPRSVKTLSLVAGDSSSLGSANIKHAQKQKLIRQLRRLDADAVVLDLGGDTTFNTLDFFLRADDRLVVTTPDPASVLDAYNFIKVGLLRALGHWVTGPREDFALGAEDLLKHFAEGGRNLPGFLADLEAADRKAATAVAGVLAAVRPKLVLNLSDPADGKAVIERIRQVCRQHLRIDVDLCHLVPIDPEIPRATRQISNVIGARNQGRGSQAIWALAQTLAAALPRPPARKPERVEARTTFFQPPATFAALTGLLDGVAQRALAGRRDVDAWCLAGQGGEGPYSLAIALDEAIGRRPRPGYHVWVTGGSTAELERARRGVYARPLIDGVRGDTLRTYFGPGPSAGVATLREAIRQRVTFFETGQDAPPISGPFDLVLVPLAAEALPSLWAGPLGRSLPTHVRPGGLLVVPHWPHPDLPLAGFRAAAEGIFLREG